jgi:hypothetical protein
MVALIQRIIKLENKVAGRPLSSNVIYQPSEEEWAAAMDILVSVQGEPRNIGLKSGSRRCGQECTDKISE